RRTAHGDVSRHENGRPSPTAAPTRRSWLLRLLQCNRLEQWLLRFFGDTVLPKHRFECNLFLLASCVSTLAFYLIALSSFMMPPIGSSGRAVGVAFLSFCGLTLALLMAATLSTITVLVLEWSRYRKFPAPIAVGVGIVSCLFFSLRLVWFWMHLASPTRLF